MSYYGPHLPPPPRPRSGPPFGRASDDREHWLGKALIAVVGAGITAVTPRAIQWWTDRRQSVQRVREAGRALYGACRDRTDPLCMQREGVWKRHSELKIAIDRVRSTSDDELQKTLGQLTVGANELAEAADSVERTDPSSIDHVRWAAKNFLVTLERLDSPVIDDQEASH